MIVLLITGLLLMQTPELSKSLYKPENCTNPEKRAEILTSDADKIQVLQLLKAHTASREGQSKVLVERLETRAKMSKTEVAALFVKVFQDVRFKAAVDAGASLGAKMEKEFLSMTDAKDSIGNCFAAVAMAGMLPQIQASADRQWLLIDQAVEAEAKRRNISLDD